MARVQINKADPQTQWGPGLGIPPLKGGPEKRAGGGLQPGRKATAEREGDVGCDGSCDVSRPKKSGWAAAASLK